MKTARKLTAVLMAAVLAVTALTISVFATPLTTADDVIKAYDLYDYAKENFEEETLSEALSFVKEPDVQDGVLHVKYGNFVAANTPLIFGAKTVKAGYFVGVSVKIAGDGSAPTLVFRLEGDFGTSSALNLTLAPNGAAYTFTVPGCTPVDVALDTTAAYEAAVTLYATDDGFKLKVNGTSYNVEYAVDSVSYASVTLPNTKNAGVTVDVDDLAVFACKTTKNPEDVANAYKNLAESFYASATPEQKDEFYHAMAVAYNGGYYLGNLGFPQPTQDEVINSIRYYFGQKFVDASAKLPEVPSECETPYAERIANLEECEALYALVTNDFKEAGAYHDAYENAKVLMEREQYALGEAATDVAYFASAFAGVDFASETYADLAARVALVATFPAEAYAGYPGLAAALAVKENIAVYLAKLDEDAEAFLAALAEYEDLSEETSYEDRFDKYNEIYNLVVTDTTINEEIAGALERFDIITEDLMTVYAKEMRFNEILAQADKTTAFSVLALLMEEAETLLGELEKVGYVLSSSALDAYNALEASVKEVSDARDVYKAAVAEMNDTMGYTALLAAFAEAKIAKEAFDVYGVIGLTDLTATNIAYAKYEGKLETIELCANNFMDAVEAAEAATTFADRYTTILAAKALEDNADSAYAGVSAKKTKLAALIAAYDADVNETNETFASAANALGEMSAATTDSDIIDKIVSFFGKLFK